MYSTGWSPGWWSRRLRPTTVIGFIMQLFNTETGAMSGLGWMVMLTPWGFILAMNMGFQRWSARADSAVCRL